MLFAFVVADDDEMKRWKIRFGIGHVVIVGQVVVKHVNLTFERFLAKTKMIKLAKATSRKLTLNIIIDMLLFDVLSSSESIRCA